MRQADALIVVIAIVFAIMCVIFCMIFADARVKEMHNRINALATENQELISFQCYSGKGCSALIKEANQSSRWIWLEQHK